MQSFYTPFEGTFSRSQEAHPRLSLLRWLTAFFLNNSAATISFKSLPTPVAHNFQPIIIDH